CLMLYSAPEWDIVQRRLEKMPNVGSKARLLQRLLIGHATDVQLDAAGRVLLPQMLRDHAGLKKKVVTVGQSNKIELWSEEIWNGGMENWLSAKGRQSLLDSEEFGSLQI
ncbi:MAG: division/cell wall cluster transcriptional repressor MraZ, partial [Pseudomonadota bacterium]